MVESKVFEENEPALGWNRQMITMRKNAKETTNYTCKTMTRNTKYSFDFHHALMSLKMFFKERNKIYLKIIVYQLRHIKSDCKND